MGEMPETLVDRTVALIGLIVLSPILLAIGAVIRLTSRGPALFLQERVGRDGCPFRIVKFRTMTVAPPDRDGMQLTVGGDRRITPIGAFLRRFKLDEIPQLVNVLRGDMRLVGPRPEVPRYVAQYGSAQRETLAFAPGMTDVASLYYRSESEELAEQPDPEAYYLNVILPRKIELNRRYLVERTFWGDITIILLTALVAVSPGWGARHVRHRVGRRYLSDGGVYDTPP